VPYVRVSLMRPRAGEEERVRELIDRLVSFFSTQPGFLSGYRLEPVEPDGYMGRIGVWETAEQADRAAQANLDLALRSQMNMSLEEHLEYSFHGTVPTKA
jgi:heme-degrading monooxygenase HmoA